MENEIEKLKKRIEELEKRPVAYPVIYPIQIPSQPQPYFLWHCPCGKNYPHTCVIC